jgi:hypothetical protein
LLVAVPLNAAPEVVELEDAALEMPDPLFEKPPDPAHAPLREPYDMRAPAENPGPRNPFTAKAIGRRSVRAIMVDSVGRRTGRFTGRRVGPETTVGDFPIRTGVAYG